MVVHVDMMRRTRSIFRTYTIYS